MTGVTYLIVAGRAKIVFCIPPVSLPVTFHSVPVNQRLSPGPSRTALHLKDTIDVYGTVAVWPLVTRTLNGLNEARPEGFTV
jgi:hypothetical protein